MIERSVEHLRLQRALRIFMALLMIAPATALALDDQNYATWTSYGGHADSSSYSSLRQIDRSNVRNLEVAWTYPTRDRVIYMFSPFVIGRTMFVYARHGGIAAIDAGDGRELWTHPAPSGGSPGRGFSYWESPDQSDRRLFVAWNDRLYALNAQTGAVINTFGVGGSIDLKENDGRDPKDIPRIQSRTPGRVFENLIIMGSAMGEDYVSPRGDIRAYDVRTGKLAWVFHTVPYPNEPGYATWPKDAYKYAGAANVWGDITVDQKNALVFLPTGSTTYDFYGADRPGDNLYGDCILALDARTGKLIWHFQTVHHDLLDYDNVAAPQLLTATVDGKRRDIVAFAGKTGFLYVFDRLTGHPVWPIEERPVPQSTVPGEHSSRTQPFPTKPPAFAVQRFTADDLNPMLSESDKVRFTKMIKAARNDGIFTPPSLGRYTLNMPGHSGGAGLFAPSSDPLTGEMFVVAMNAPAFLKLVPDPNGILDNSYHGPTISSWNGCESVCPDDTDDLPELQTSSKAVARIDPAVRAKGRAVFEANCQACHGAQLQGGGDAPSLLNVTQRRDERAIRGILQNGEGEMPSFGQLPDEAVTVLIAYLSDPGIIPKDATNSSVGTPYPPGAVIPNGGQRYFTGWGFAPAIIKPPFSTLTAYDLNSGTIKWQIPYGNAVGYEPKDNNFGNLQYHGPKASPAVTATGLLIAAMMDNKLRVWDKDTGKLIWSKDLPDRAAGIPAIYELGGRQFVTISVRGQYMAFALPRRSSSLNIPFTDPGAHSSGRIASAHVVAAVLAGSAGQVSQGAAAPADADPRYGPQFTATQFFTDADVSGLRHVGYATWSADGDDIVGRPSQPDGGWLFLDPPMSNVAFYADIYCPDTCKAGVLLRAEQTADGGTKGVFIAFDAGDRSAYSIKIDADGREISKQPLPLGVSAGGLPTAAGNSPPEISEYFKTHPTKYPMPPGVNIAGIEPPAGQYHRNGWNELNLILYQDALRPQMNGAVFDTTMRAAIAADSVGRYGPVALYAGGGAEVRFRDVRTDDLMLHRVEKPLTSSHFRRQRLENFYYSISASAGDINKDGHPDIVIGPHVFYGPDFRTYGEIYTPVAYNPTTDYTQKSMSNFVYDFTGDGWPDVLIMSGNAGFQTATLYVNPHGESRHWDSFVVAKPVGNETKILADIVGDGRPALIHSFEGMIAYSRPQPGDPTGTWIRTVISEKGPWGEYPTHGAGIGDINGDGKPDYVSPFGWWENPGKVTNAPLWKFHPCALGRSGSYQPTPGASIIGVYDVNGDGLNDVVTALEGHAFGLAWYEQKRNAAGDISFVRHMIMDNFLTANAGNVLFTGLHAVAFGDIDGDGVPDIVTGRRVQSHMSNYNEPDSQGAPVLFLYHTVRDPAAPGGARFEPELIDNESGVGSQLVVADLDGDGRNDIVTASALGAFVFLNRGNWHEAAMVSRTAVTAEAPRAGDGR